MSKKTAHNMEGRTGRGWAELRRQQKVADKQREAAREVGRVPKLILDPPRQYACAACRDTGRASNGGFCLPCVVRGRVSVMAVVADGSMARELDRMEASVKRAMSGASE